MLKHTVGVHHNEDMAKVQFGMAIIKYTNSSFEHQVRESVVIQAESQEHNILNSRTENTRCSLPRLCAQVGEYKNYSSELEVEKREEDKIEAKIRQLRKDKNKARLHPCWRENGPDKKRRKVDENNYITINEVQQEKNKNKEQIEHKQTE